MNPCNDTGLSGSLQLHIGDCHFIEFTIILRGPLAIRDTW